MDEIALALDRRLDPRAGTPLIVAFSGGGDSLALLQATQRWADAARRRLVAVTVDHGLRAASAEWTRWCADRAARLGVDHRALEWRGDKPRVGVPARARQVRHCLLAQAARDAGAAVVLLGHTLDDILEARAMRAAGGSVGEPREWAPSPVWPEGRGVFLLRPMLALRRAAVRRWLRERGETWIDDPANADPASPRARARLAASPGPPRPPPSHPARPPCLEEKETAGAALLGRAAIGLAGEARLSLAGLDHAERRRLLGAALVCVGGGERPPRRRSLEALLARVEAGREGTATLAGARARFANQEVLITREPAAIPGRKPAARPLPVGEALLWDGRYRITARAPGLAVRALAGVASRLAKPAVLALRRVAAPARGGLPAIVAANGDVHCPILEPVAIADLSCLVEARLAGALGAIADEAGANAWRPAAGRTKSRRPLEGDCP